MAATNLYNDPKTGRFVKGNPGLPRQPLDPKLLETARWYTNGGHKEAGDLMPSIKGLARYLGTSRDNLWSNRKRHREFDEAMEDLLAEQERLLINHGLAGDWNAQIVSLALAKHGYTKKARVNPALTKLNEFNPPETNNE